MLIDLVMFQDTSNLSLALSISISDKADELEGECSREDAVTAASEVVLDSALGEVVESGTEADAASEPLFQVCACSIYHLWSRETVNSWSIPIPLCRNIHCRE